ncbi:hypothetical protein GALL_453870 [mine drainage metagenome]|uniref:Uncharacterized protein n=1 Tax=mine drainage metagenome TaxID=410659 RepID=A0A1J5Q690_9ZZZZ
MILQAAHAVVVGGQEDQAILLETRLIATGLQNLSSALDSEALATTAEGSVRRQHHKAQLPVIGNVPAGRENVDAAKHAGGKALLHTIANGGEHVLFVLEAAFALLHFPAQVRAGIEPEAVISAVQIVESVAQSTQRVLVNTNLLIRLRHTQDDALKLKTSHHLTRSGRRATQENGAC